MIFLLAVCNFVLNYVSPANYFIITVDIILRNYFGMVSVIKNDCLYWFLIEKRGVIFSVGIRGFFFR